MHFSIPTRPWVLAALVPSLFLGLLLTATPADADKKLCRKGIAKVAGVLAKKRVKLIARCEDAASCDSVRLSNKLDKVKQRGRKKLLSSCRQLAGSDLGLGSTCPDPTGRCQQVLDSEQALSDCLLCMVAETIDPLLRRLRGTAGVVGETCGGCSATPCTAPFFCDSPEGRCDDTTSVGLCIEAPTACPDVIDPVCGCNGATYSNDCLRQQAQVGRAHGGPCTSFCGGASGNTCPAGTTCTALPGHCDSTTDEGLCVHIPVDCTVRDVHLCGCDGVTYGNECELLASGVRLDHVGPCEQLPCGFDVSGAAGCGPGMFCEMAPGACTSPGSDGICLALPDACPEILAPVCGCDAVSYGNDCLRMQAGVGLLHEGECGSVCSGPDAAPCPAGHVCELAAGSCDIAGLEGHCVAAPEICPDIYEPVCDCSGTTHINDCERLAVGAQLAHFGECFGVCDPNLPGSCPGGGTCIPPPGFCDLTNESICVPMPDVCPQHMWPVCGCDGVSYDNPCLAVQAGAGIAHEGPCGSSQGCTATDCGPGSVCLPLPGTCFEPDPPGECVVVPDACPQVFDPVCGCDGVVYSTACHALSAGVAVDHPGDCFSVNTGCTPGLGGCGPGTVCVVAPGMCGNPSAPSFCVAVPEFCPTNLMIEVCGCDGTTYPTACDAVAVGAAIAHEGPCF